MLPHQYTPKVAVPTALARWRGPLSFDTTIVAEIRATFRWPSHGLGDDDHLDARSEDEVTVDVTTVLELCANERFVRVTTSWDNTALDHRLRVHFPLPAATSSSDAGCAFAVVARALEQQGNPYEASIGTWPAHGFADSSASVDGTEANTVGLAVLHDGVFEYEVVHDGGRGRELALTLARCVGFLSREHMRLRQGGAGPYVPTRGTQLLGPNTARYGVYLHRHGWEDGSVPAVAAAFADPFDAVVAQSPGAGRFGSFGSRLHVDGGAVTAVTRDRDGRLIVRAVRLSTGPGTLRVDLDGTPAAGVVVDLDGHERTRFAGELAVRAHEIVTLRLDETP